MLCLSAYLPIGTWLVCTFQLLGLMLYIYTHRWFKSPLLSLGYTLRRRVARSCGISMSNLLRNGRNSGWESCPSIHVPRGRAASILKAEMRGQTLWAAEPETFALSCQKIRQTRSMSLPGAAHGLTA